MKKLTIVLTAMALAAVLLPAALFAKGTTESVGPWGTAGERVTATGTFQLDEGHPQLQADGKTYDLMVPGFYRYGSSTVPVGSTVTVEGYTFQPGPRAYNTDSDLRLRVEKVSYNGQTYDLSSTWYGGPRGMRQAQAPRQGMGPGRGPGGGPGGYRSGSMGPGYGPRWN
ncbi:hypothetical protein [Salinispira pacifica]